METRDELAAGHKQWALDWLSSTADVFRRAKPKTPSPHLVSYFLLGDPDARQVLLCDHRLAGLWLPTGGHVEPGEHPAETVRRETREELGIDAHFHPAHHEQPFFLTVTETVGAPESRHVDVTLWYAIVGEIHEPLRPDEREFAAVRWWTETELDALDPMRREPHLPRAISALTANGW
ncbi:NUDIX domain-containing protein [Flexivirga caeni]|uniref:NUDIX domain-containing protein n=2 Tax=Flexivirga caeni TaxID=2294115 RepID=A0A3M9MJ07_9MICO|nr:NUDIX domain-containing protein [Flexivirga caeni]